MYYLKYFKADILTLNVSCRRADMMSLFWRCEREICLMFNHTLGFDKIYMQQNHCLNSLQQPFFQSVSLEQYAGTIHVKVHPLQKCFGFLDSTAKEIIRSYIY